MRRDTTKITVAFGKYVHAPNKQFTAFYEYEVAVRFTQGQTIPYLRSVIILSTYSCLVFSSGFFLFGSLTKTPYSSTYSTTFST